MVVEELVDGVGQQLVLAVEQVVHVDLHFPDLEVKVRVDHLQNLKSRGKLKINKNYKFKKYYLKKCNESNLDLFPFRILDRQNTGETLGCKFKMYSYLFLVGSVQCSEQFECGAIQVIWFSVIQSDAVWCSVTQYHVVWCSVMQY